MHKVNIHQDAQAGIWSISNDHLECRVQLREGRLTWSIIDKSSGRVALGPSELPQVQLDGQPLLWSSPLHTDEALQADGSTTLHMLTQANGIARLSRYFQVWPDQPFVRTWGVLENGDEQPHTVTHADILRLSSSAATPLNLFHVDQFSWVYRRDFFNQHQVRLTQGRAPVEIRMGAFPSSYWGATSCAWFAVRDGKIDRPDTPPHLGSGFVVGIEFNGKSHLVGRAVSPPSSSPIDDAEGTASLPSSSLTDVTEATASLPPVAAVHDSGRADSPPYMAHLVSTVDELNHRLEPGEAFDVPACFVGLFQGDWDEAGYVTQRFAEAHIHPPMPDEQYPWVQYNSWGYDQNIDEAQQLAAMERCARMGVEVVVLDLGWATQIGEWRAHPTKFPRGLRLLSDRAHELGLKFGLHIPLAQANVASPVGQAHPDWLIHEGNDYFGAAPLCLGHAPCREWLIDQIVRLIDDYGVDYFVQDGEDMVKRCEKTTHTHAPGDSNYANSTQGLDVVIETLRRLRPNVIWENCEDGGCMLTYKMARLYHTTITVDNIATYATRQGVYGASYPFSLRYSVRYMQDDPTPYTLRSAIFGGPLILMQRVTKWSEEQIAQTRAAIDQYKQLRGLVRNAKVIHLLPPRYNVEGIGWGWDAIQAVSPDQSRAVVMVYRAMGDTPRKTICPRGLRADAPYRVRLGDREQSLELSGAVLASEGIEVELPEMASEMIHINLLNA